MATFEHILHIALVFLLLILNEMNNVRNLLKSYQ